MAERDKHFEDNFHQTSPPDFYDDLNSLSFGETNRHIEEDTMQQIPNATAPPIPMDRYSIRPQVYGQMIPPKVYDGKSDPRMWLSHYNAISEANLWNAQMKLKRVIGSLDGPAYTWFMNRRSIGQMTTWPSFEEALVARFSNALDKFMLTQTIRDIKMKGKDFDNYFETKYGLIKSHLKDISEYDVMTYIFEGLPEDLKKRVMEQLLSRRCETAEELRILIREIMEVDNFRKEDTFGSLRRSRSHSNAYVEIERENNWQPRSEFNRSDRRVRQLEKELKQLKNIVQDNREQNRELRQTIPNYGRKNQVTNDNNWKKNIQCFGCKNFGHYSNECPIKTPVTSSSIECYNCHENGHVSKECPKRKPIQNIECFKCHENGHYSRDCPIKNNTKRKVTFKESSQGNTNRRN